jgi:(p)ppGpp synthase/HD superfamily hydrolase
LWKELEGRLKDYIAAPKENGYESLHFAVCLGDNANWSPHMEIQIRTAAMHAMAEGGLASHSLYKGGLTDPEQVYYMSLTCQMGFLSWFSSVSPVTFLAINKP